MIKELVRVGIDMVMLPEKDRFLQFASALKVYGHSTAVQLSCIVRASEVDTNTDYDIVKFYEKLIQLSISQHPVKTGALQVKDATALQARTITQQLKGSKGAGKKEKHGKKGSTSTHQPAAKESSESNPHTKALVDRKAKETGESAAGTVASVFSIQFIRIPLPFAPSVIFGEYLEQLQLPPLSHHRSALPKLVNLPEEQLQLETATRWTHHIQSQFRRVRERSHLASR
jgi:hypothetical protein